MSDTEAQKARAAAFDAQIASLRKLHISVKEIARTHKLSENQIRSCVQRHNARTQPRATPAAPAGPNAFTQAQRADRARTAAGIRARISVGEGPVAIARSLGITYTRLYQILKATESDDAAAAAAAPAPEPAAPTPAFDYDKLMGTVYEPTQLRIVVGMLKDGIDEGTMLDCLGIDSGALDELCDQAGALPGIVVERVLEERAHG